MSVVAAGVLSALFVFGQTNPDPAIVGYVVDPSDTPVAQAEVVFTAGPALDCAVQILEHTVTDGSGRFRLVRPSAERLRVCAASGSCIPRLRTHGSTLAKTSRRHPRPFSSPAMTARSPRPSSSRSRPIREDSRSGMAATST